MSQCAANTKQSMRAAVILLSSVLISSSHCNLVQVLMSAVSKTLNGKQSIDPSTFMSEAASQLVGEEDEEIKNNVGICFFHTKYL